MAACSGDEHNDTGKTESTSPRETGFELHRSRHYGVGLVIITTNISNFAPGKRPVIRIGAAPPNVILIVVVQKT